MADKVEDIDIRILRLLGLEDVFDLDYDDYYQLLREAITKGSFGQTKLSEEELARLANERKRVRGKKGRFKPNKKSPNVSKNNAIKFISPSKKGTKATTVKQESEKSQESLLNIVISIRESVQGIYESLLSQTDLIRKNYELDRRRRESGSRKRKEDDLESVLSKTKGLISKVLSPVQGILDQIIRFITFTLLGKAVTALFEWLKDPENKKKFNSLIRFFGDHWKLFAGIFILFGTSFGAFVRGMLKAVAKGLIALAINIPKIKKFLRRNPRLAMLGLSVASLGSGLLANTLNPPEAKKEGDQLKDLGKDDFKQASRDSEQASKVNVPTLKMGGMIPRMPQISLYNNGSSLKNPSMDIIDGMVGNRGIPFSGGGKDNRLFPTTNGGAVGLNGNEFIVNEGGVRMVGIPFLESINRAGGGKGANKPKMIASNNIKIKGAFSGGQLNIGGFGGSSSGRSLNIKGFQNGGALGGLKNMMTGAGNAIMNVIRPQPARATGPSKPTTGSGSWYGPAPIPEHKTPEVKAFLRTIRFAEHSGAANPYNAIFGGAVVPLTKMTVKEVIDMQNSDMLPQRLGGGRAPFKRGGTWSSVASGAYQFMPDTLNDLIRSNVIKPTEIMTPDVQDRAGWALAKEKRGLTLESLRKNKLSAVNLDKVAPEWASLPTLEGKSFYGQPVKEAFKLQKIYNESLKKYLGPQSFAPPPGPPVRGGMKTIMLPEINLPPQTIAASNSTMTNIGDEDMNVRPIDPSSQRTRSENISILGIGAKPA